MRPDGTRRNVPGQLAEAAQAAALPPIAARTPENREPVPARRTTGGGCRAVYLGGRP